MALQISDFWKLTADSRLFSPAQVDQWMAAFSQIKGAAKQGNASTLAEWLIAEKALTRYQATILLAGRAGPFVYGDYCVSDRIGAGRLAGLFRAIHTPSGQAVVLHFLSGTQTQNSRAVALAYQQVVQARAADGPYLSKCYDLVDLGSFKFVVLESLHGETLADRLAAKGPMSPEEACRNLRMVAIGLSNLHERGQIHGDVRPANIWLEGNGPAKLLQVPLSRDPFATVGPLDFAALESTGRIEAMADYLAPELAHAGVAPSPATDLYSLGCSLYHIVSGRPPFDGGDWRQKIMRHSAEAIRPLTQFGASPQLAQAVSYLMAKDPNIRYQQASQVAEALAYFVAQEKLAVAAEAPTPSMEAFEKSLSRSGSAGAHATSPSPVAPSAPTGPTVSTPTPLGSSAYPPTAANLAPPIRMESAPVNAGFPTAVGGAVSQAGPGYNLNDGGLATAAAPGHAPLGYGYSPVATYAGPTPLGVGESPPTMFAPAHAPAAETLAFGPYVDPAPARHVPYAPAPSATPKSINQRLFVFAGVITMVLMVALFFVLKGGSKTDSDAGKGSSGPGDSVASTGPNSTNKGTGGSSTSTGDDKKSKSGTKDDAANDDTGKKGSGGASTSDKEKEPAKTPVPTPPKPPEGPEIDDDEKTLYASPTKGKRLELKYIPKLTNVIAVIRPADILSHPEGEKLWAALGPAGKWLQSQIETIALVNPRDINQLTIVLYDNPSGPFSASFVLKMNNKLAGAELLQRWGNPPKVQHADHTFFQGPEWSYYFPGKEGETVLVIADVNRMKEIIEAEKSSPLGNLKIERLLVDSDALRHFTLLFVPEYLFNDGRKSTFSGPLQPVEKALEDFLGNSTKAALFSIHLSKTTFFAELRLNSAGGDPGGVAREFSDRVKKLPDEVENYLATLNPQPYARKLLNRFPQVLRYLKDYTRYGIDNDQAVLRCHLPLGAGQHLFLSTELSLAQKGGQNYSPGTGPANGGGSGAPPASGVAGKLKKVTSLMFPRDTLEKTMVMISDDVGVPIEIIGGDLQLEGITKNQSFGLDEKDKPADEILRKVLKQANPDGKLIYVIKPKAPGGPDMIFITTRASAEKRGDKIPAELVIIEPPKTKK